jgi:hypothetical protein
VWDANDVDGVLVKNRFGQWYRDEVVMENDAQHLGTSVAISGDGNVLMLGAADSATGGAVYVYMTYPNLPWFSQGKRQILNSFDAVGMAKQGCSVSLSYSGEVALLGGYTDDNNNGAAYMYAYDAESKSYLEHVVHKRAGPHPYCDALDKCYAGYRVALAANTAVMSAPGIHSAFVYNNIMPVTFRPTPKPSSVTLRSSMPTSQPTRAVQVKLGGDYPSICTANAVAMRLYGGGDIAVVGRSCYNNWSGEMLIYQYTQDRYALKLRVVGGTSEALGASVAITRSGGVIVAGAPYAKSKVGVVYVYGFDPADENYAEEAQLEGSGYSGFPHFGSSVDISGNGLTILVGGPEDQGWGVSMGAVWVFVKSNFAWHQQDNKLFWYPGATTGIPHQGNSVRLSDNGNTAVVGAWTDENGHGSIAIWTRDYFGGVWTFGEKIYGSGTVKFGKHVAISGDGNVILVGTFRDDDLANNQNGGGAYLYTKDGKWSLEVD